jgi:hypothetical protein
MSNLLNGTWMMVLFKLIILGIHTFDGKELNRKGA